MSAYKRLDRVIVKVAGHLHPILSIRENGKGSLILKPRRAVFNLQDGIRRPTVDQKITIHVNDLGGANTVHHTLRSADGSTVETFLMTSAVANGNSNLLYRHTLPSLMGTPTQSPRGKDRLHKVGTYLPTHSTLHIAVLVAPPQAEQQIIEASSVFTHILLPFKRFTLIVAWSYSLLPSMVEGWLTHYGTAEVSRNGERNGVFLPIAPGLNPSDAKGFLESQLGLSHCDSFARAVELLKNEPRAPPETIPQFMHQCFNLGLRPEPYIPSNQRTANSDSVFSPFS